MRRNGTREAMVLLVVLMAIVGVGGQAWSAVPRPAPDVQRTDPPAATALASGSFSCSVQTVDPPNGTGIPEASAGITFTGYLGLVGTSMTQGVFLGTGAGLNQTCQTFADQMSTRARSFGCTASPIRIVDTIGGNFIQKQWFLDILCVNQANGVVEAVGALLADIVTAPAAQLQRTSLESREPSSRDSSQSTLQPLRQRLPADR